jgi:hypothetical protein
MLVTWFERFTKRADAAEAPKSFAALLLEHDLAMEQVRGAAAALADAKGKAAAAWDKIARHELASCVGGGLTTQREQLLGRGDRSHG